MQSHMLYNLSNKVVFCEIIRKSHIDVMYKFKSSWKDFQESKTTTLVSRMTRFNIFPNIFVIHNLMTLWPITFDGFCSHSENSFHKCKVAKNWQMVRFCSTLCILSWVLKLRSYRTMFLSNHNWRRCKNTHGMGRHALFYASVCLMSSVDENPWAWTS